MPQNTRGFLYLAILLTFNLFKPNIALFTHPTTLVLLHNYEPMPLGKPRTELRFFAFLNWGKSSGLRIVHDWDKLEIIKTSFEKTKMARKRKMALDVRIFEDISPSRFITFTIPNPISQSHVLRFAVLDSPLYSTESSSSPRVAAMFVPKHRESDWIFSTESGHLQLLLDLPDISRLIVIGGDDVSNAHRPSVEDDDDESKRLEMRLKPLVVALSPKTLSRDEIDDVTFVIYEDNVVSSVEIERSAGPFVGEMVIEDVEIEIDEVTREFRRRLRFKRMPNLVQSDIRIVPSGTYFRLDLTELVHPYLAPMVASLSLIGSRTDEVKCRPKALCIGVGGAGLLSFLKLRLGFDVTGVEIDPQVLRIARRYFGLEESFARVYVEDGIEFLKRVSSSCDDIDDTKYDVLMVDLDSADPIHGVSAPPVEFVVVLLSPEKYDAHVSLTSGEKEREPKDENGFLWESNEAVSNEGHEAEAEAPKENMSEL